MKTFEISELKGPFGGSAQDFGGRSHIGPQGVYRALGFHDHDKLSRYTRVPCLQDGGREGQWKG